MTMRIGQTLIGLILVLAVGCGGNDTSDPSQQASACDGVMDAQGYCYQRCNNGQCPVGQTCTDAGNGEQICVATGGGDLPSSRPNTGNMMPNAMMNPGNTNPGNNPGMNPTDPTQPTDPNVWAACPTDQQAKPATIYEVKTPNGFTDDSFVVVEGVVTARRMNADGKYSHLVIQVPTTDPNYVGPDKSGLWIYLNGSEDEALQMNPPAEGALVKVHALTSNFYDQLQLYKVVCMEMVNEQAGLPAPVDVLPAEVGTGEGERGMLMGRGEALEGVLVRVQNAKVTGTNPAVGPGDGKDPNTMQEAPTNEFVVDGNLRVNDFLYFINPQPSVDTTYSSITGILRWGNANMKLEPRSAADVQ